MKSEKKKHFKTSFFYIYLEAPLNLILDKQKGLSLQWDIKQMATWWVSIGIGIWGQAMAWSA